MTKIHQLEVDAKCTMCDGDLAFVRTSEVDGESEPLCVACWYKHDHAADKAYCDAQFRFYENMEEF